MSSDECGHRLSRSTRKRSSEIADALCRRSCPAGSRRGGRGGCRERNRRGPPGLVRKRKAIASCAASSTSLATGNVISHLTPATECNRGILSSASLRRTWKDYIFAVECPGRGVAEYRGNAKSACACVSPAYAIVCMDFSESYRVVKSPGRHRLRR